MLEVLIKLLIAMVVILIAFVIGFGLWRLVEIPMRKSRQAVFDYVYVDDNGNARELNAFERNYVTTTLFPDQAAGNIKSSYESLTGEGRTAGYLRRNQLPRRLPVASGPAESHSEHFS